MPHTPRTHEPAPHHQPLLRLTADEVQALRDLADRIRADAGWITPHLHTALDKLTTDPAA